MGELQTLPTLLGYIGPGGGIGLLGPLAGVLLAVLGALVMVLFWPLRLLFRKLRASRTPKATTATGAHAPQ